MRLGSYDVRRVESQAHYNNVVGSAPSSSATATTFRRTRDDTIACDVVFLDGTHHVFHVPRKADGVTLMEKVFEHVELVEKDYFGLQFVIVDTRDLQQKRWLDAHKSVRKQMLCPPYQLFFRVKFYVTDPGRLHEEYTRYQLFLQTRFDILEGRLPCSEGSLALLASYAAQSDLGDYNPDEHGPGYTEHIKFAPSQPDEFARRVAELHRMHIGQSPGEAEFNFLEHVKRLELYGVDIYDAKDSKGLPIGLGVNAVGVKVYHNSMKINEFAWGQIVMVSFKKKRFYLQIRIDDHPQDTVLIFNVCSPLVCKQLWKCCIEHHAFFRLKAPPAAQPKRLFNIGSKFRYSGRTEFQTVEDLKQKQFVVHRNFNRSRSKSSLVRSTNPATTPSCNSTTSSHAFSVASTHASPDFAAHGFLSGGQLLARRWLTRCNGSGSHDATSADNGYHSDDVVGSTTSPRFARHQAEGESSAPSFRRRKEPSSEESADERSWTPNMQACTSSAGVTTGVHHRNSLVNGSTRKTPTNGFANGYGGFATPVSSSYNSNGTISRAATTRSSPRTSTGGVGHSTPTTTTTTTSTTHGVSPRNSVASYSSYASAGIGGSPPRARRSPQSQKSSSPVGEDAVVCVRMRPDLHGRFGFNVKGGADQNYPVIVSRVAVGSSADKCQPRLNEGDQVLFINGRDVSTMSHDQVVAFIRSARQSPGGGELVLTIKPNVYRLGEEVDEPDSSCVPEQTRVADSVPRSDKLSQSLRLLADALVTGKIVAQFEQSYRKKPGMTMNDCRLTINVNKNRYRDVCPYDATRVFLNSSPTGDYINANFVNMEIPSSGIVNRYIACQGPLAHTSSDFWLMVWEQLCSTVVMLTTTTERGRIKCHQYWPRLYESQEYGRLVVRCIKDRQTPNCYYREFSVRDRTTNEERRVTQMQYVAWPDHGVPDDPKHFIAFVDEVRKARTGVDPIVVHCSAGIGRTGVLILMETAACLVEANEPVYPLDIVRTMRDQRAMLIQTAGQYTFVCQSILEAYEEGVVQPLAEYQKRG